MEPLSFNVQNIIDGQGIGIAVTGMVIVFCVLATISIFIALLPKVLGFIAQHIPEVEHHDAPAPSPSQDDDVVVAAIGYVMHTRLRDQS